MGKGSTTYTPLTAPEFTPSVVRYGGVDISKTYKDTDGNVITEYIQSAEDKALDEWRKSQISELEPQVNVFSPELQQSWSEIANAQKNQSVDQFNALWDPVARSTREDLWSRGLGNSSIASDTQKNQDQIKAKALESIANDYVAEMKNLQNTELANRYTYLNYLNGGIENMSQDALSAMTTGLLNNSNANSSNLDTWKTLLSQYNYNQQNSNQNKGWFYPLF